MAPLSPERNPFVIDVVLIAMFEK
ncbi:unnamed protein product, partial [Allacma fusca]